MSEEERVAVRAVSLSQSLRRHRRELEQLKTQGIEDPQKERIVEALEKEIAQ